MALWNNVKVLESSDKNVLKYVFEKDDAVAESVLYKYPTYEDRTVICCSTQSGCPVGCRFCFMPGTLIQTDQDTFKQIESLSTEDEVIGINGKNKINNVFLQNYSGEMIEIELENGQFVTVTADHEMIYMNNICVEAHHLKIGDDLLV